MRGEAVAQCVRVDGFGDACSTASLPADMPDRFIRIRLVPTAPLQAREQPPVLSFQGAVIGAKLVEQLWTERNLSILAAFALADADHHAFLIDVLWTQTAQLGAAHASGVQGHEDSAVPQVTGGVDEVRHFFSAQYDRDLPTGEFGQGQIIAREAPPQNLVDQESQRRCMPRNRPGVELPLLQKVQLIFPDMLQAELIGGAVEMLSELPHRADVAPCGSLRVITALDLVEHPFSKLGHRDLLVTHTLSVQADCRIFHVRVASAAQAAELCAGHVQQLGGESPPPNLME